MVIPCNRQRCRPRARSAHGPPAPAERRRRDERHFHDAVELEREQRPPDRDAVRYPVLMTVKGTGGRLVRKTFRLEARIDADGVTIGFPEDF